VRKGEFIAIVGPSGCGKSTFMKLATGLKMPSHGQDPDRRPAGDRAAQDFGHGLPGAQLLPWRTTVDNVLLPLEIVEPYRSNFKQKRKEYEERARKLLQKVGLAGLRGQVPLAAVGRHAAARQHLPRADPRAQDAAAGRALRRARRLHPRRAVVHLRDLWTEQQFNVILVTHDLRERSSWPTRCT
jgi:NitT/TauT family transport system ATP-binding protein